MKIYTEEQVREIASTIYSGHFDCNDTPDDLVDELTPIELPSDEEIKAQVEPMGTLGDIGFIEGAKWVIEQIKQQGNETLHNTTD